MAAPKGFGTILLAIVTMVCLLLGYGYSQMSVTSSGAAVATPMASVDRVLAEVVLPLISLPSPPRTPCCESSRISRALTWKVMKVREELKRTNAVVAEIHKEAQVHEFTVSASPQLRSNVRES